LFSLRSPPVKPDQTWRSLARFACGDAAERDVLYEVLVSALSRSSHGAAPLLEGLSQTFARSCPIALYTATSSAERVAFRQINKKTGNRLRQQLIDEESGQPIDPDDKGRGYEVEKGVYIRRRA
jgi:hypothetical protein